MALAKKTYTDLVTVIPADNLNDIQDSIIILENAKTADEVILNNLRTDVDENTDSIGDLSDLTTESKTDLVSAINEAASSGSGVPSNVRQAMLTLFESAAYAETGLTDEIAVIESWASEVTDITLSASTLSLNADTPQTLVATTVPSGSTVVWSTSDATIATVAGGVVTGVSNGTCTITASAGDVSATCAVTVTGFATLESISAVYTQSGTVYDTDSLDDLKADLVVTANYDDSSTEVVTNYVLSGTLAEGTSTITVSYGGKTTTFTVEVSDSEALPEGYTKVEYLYSNATSTTMGSYIVMNTLESSIVNATANVDFMTDGFTDGTEYLVGTRQKNTGTTNNVGWAIGLSSDHSKYTSWSGSPGATIARTDENRHTAIATYTTSGVTLQIDNGEVATLTQTSRDIGGYPICLFGLKHATLAEGGTPQFYKGRIYTAEFEVNGTTVMKAVPCVRDSDGKAGMFNIIDQTFYAPYNIGSGKTITAGPVVSA